MQLVLRFRFPLGKGFTLSAINIGALLFPLAIKIVFTGIPGEVCVPQF